MTDSTEHDEKFESWVTKAAGEYNAPAGDVPRDEMWAAIAAARKEARVSAGGVSPARRYLRIGAALAATLVIGIAIGKYALNATKDTTSTVASAPVTDTASGDDQNNPTIGRAAQDHMSRAEALLTAYTALPDATADTLMSRWARDLLRDTRLMLDSPAARDLQRQKLLQDLEVVLVQMVQRAPADGVAEERSHVNRTLQRTQVLPRLRSAQRSGPTDIRM